MSGDPLDAVGQGHGWYGYNLPRLDPNGGQSSGESSSNSLDPTRRPGRLMADQLFGGVGNQPPPPQQQQQQRKHQQQATGVGDSLPDSSRHANSSRLEDQQRKQMLLSSMSPAPHPQPQSVPQAANVFQRPASDPAASALMYPLFDLQNQALLMQSEPPRLLPQTGNNSHAVAAAAAAAAAAAGHYAAFDFSLPQAMAGLVGAAGSSGSAAQQSSLMNVTGGAGVGGDSYGPVGANAGLGMRGWCFPSSMSAGVPAPVPEPTGPTLPSVSGVSDQFRTDGAFTQLGPASMVQHSGMIPVGPSVDAAAWTGDVWGQGVLGTSRPDLPSAVAPAERERVPDVADGGGAGGGSSGTGSTGRANVQLDASELKRQERNAREQRRSLMTSQQIDKLRRLLLESGIHTKANKCSILSEVAQYMTQLEERLAQLEGERQEWLNETAESAGVDRRDPNGGAIDCNQIFSHTKVALAMATVEGRLMDSNARFKTLSGYSEEDLKHLTVLRLAEQSDLQEIFEQLSAMLTDGTGKAPKNVTTKAVVKNENEDLRLSVSLARDALGRPKFFLCSLLPACSPAGTTSPSPSSSSKSSFSSGDDDIVRLAASAGAAVAANTPADAPAAAVGAERSSASEGDEGPPASGRQALSSPRGAPQAAAAVEKSAVKSLPEDTRRKQSDSVDAACSEVK